MSFVRIGRKLVKRYSALSTFLFLGQNLWVCLAAYACRQSIAPHAEDSINGRRYFLAGVVRAKDESRFLPEYIAHHILLGFEHVYVYDNNSSDNLEQVLKPFIARNLVTYIPWPQIPAYPSCYTHFLNEHAANCRWVAFFDADEFIFERELGVLLETLKSWRHPALAINWRYFGSSFFETIPNGLVTKNFQHADRLPDRHVKVIVDPRTLKRFRNAHGFYYTGARLGRTAAGHRAFGSFAAFDHNPMFLIHHYVYRSRQDYVNKLTRGFGDAAGGADRARRSARTDSEFPRHNEQRFEPPESVVARTATFLRELGFGPELTGESGSADTEAQEAHLESARPDS